MEQKNTVQFTGCEGKIKLFCDSDTPLGELHDFLLMLKGNIIDRMIKSHQEEAARAEAESKIEPIPQTDHFQQFGE